MQRHAQQGVELAASHAQVNVCSYARPRQRNPTEVDPGGGQQRRKKISGTTRRMERAGWRKKNQHRKVAVMQAWRCYRLQVACMQCMRAHHAMAARAALARRNVPPWRETRAQDPSEISCRTLTCWQRGDSPLQSWVVSSQGLGALNRGYRRKWCKGVGGCRLVGVGAGRGGRYTCSSPVPAVRFRIFPLSSAV